MNRNPTGKGGFAEHPENRNPGGWKPEVTFSYQYKRFMNMTAKQLAKFAVQPDSKRKVVEDLAFKAVMRAKKSLPDVKEITDRTEGRAPQAIDITTGGEKVQGATIIFADEPDPSD